MLNILKFLHKSKQKLFYIEIDDEELNKEITSIIINMEQEIKEFRKHIDETTWNINEEELMKLFKKMIKIKKDVSEIETDINKIVELKLHNMKYFIIKDDSYLLDKKRDLQSMKESIHTFVEIIEGRPDKKELKKIIIEELLQQLINIEKQTTKIISDDINLQSIYKKINQI